MLDALRNMIARAFAENAAFRMRALGFLAPLGKDMTPAMRAAGENKHKRHDDGR